MEEVWEKAKPNWLVWVATRPSVLTDKELRLFAVFCARQVQHLMTDPRSIEAIDVAEKYAQGKASNDELSTADAAARAAARAATDAAAWAADAAALAAYAADAAARAAARAEDAASYAAYAAYAAVRAAADNVRVAAKAAAWATSNADMKESQATWLRENTTPNFL